MSEDDLIPYVWRLSWWRQRIPATIAVVLAFLFAYGGLLGWWVVEEREGTAPWHETYEIFPVGDRSESNPGETGVFVGLFMLLPCALV